MQNVILGTCRSGNGKNDMTVFQTGFGGKGGYVQCTQICYILKIKNSYDKG